MKQAIGYTLLIVGTFALVGYLAVTLVTDYPVTTGIFAAMVLGGRRIVRLLAIYIYSKEKNK